MSGPKNRRLIWPSPEDMPLRIEEVPMPQPPTKGAIVKVQFTGICHTDLTTWKDNICPKGVFPRVLGHDIAGYIHSLGDQAKPGFKVGDAVIVYSIIGCRQCVYCKGGQSRMCDADYPEVLPVYGINRNGGFQTHLTVSEVGDLFKVDQGLPLEAACLLPCGGLTTFNSLETIRESMDMAMNIAGKATLLVIGAGGISFWVFGLARVLWPKNLKIAVVDTLEDKLQFVKQSQVDVTILSKEDDSAEDLAQKVKDACGGGIDGCVDFANIQQTVGMVLLAGNKNCTLAMVGVHKDAVLPSTILNSFPLRCLNMRGVLGGTKKQLREVQHLVSKNGVKPPPTTFVSLEQVPEVFERLTAGTQYGRAVVDMEK